MDDGPDIERVMSRLLLLQAWTMRNGPLTPYLVVVRADADRQILVQRWADFDPDTEEFYLSPWFDPPRSLDDAAREVGL
jgi:hypothetical protein